MSKMKDKPCHLHDSLKYRNNRSLPHVQHVVLVLQKSQYFVFANRRSHDRWQSPHDVLAQTQLLYHE